MEVLITPVETVSEDYQGPNDGKLLYTIDRMNFPDGTSVHWKRAEIDDEGPVRVETYAMYSPAGDPVADAVKARWHVTRELLDALIDEASGQGRPELFPGRPLLDLVPVESSQPCDDEQR
jgi:hypothetical protein